MKHVTLNKMYFCYALTNGFSLVLYSSRRPSRQVTPLPRFPERGTDLFNPLAFSPPPFPILSRRRRTRRPPYLFGLLREEEDRSNAGRTRDARALTCRPSANFLLLVSSFAPIFRSSLVQFCLPFSLPFSVYPHRSTSILKPPSFPPPSACRAIYFRICRSVYCFYPRETQTRAASAHTFLTGGTIYQ